MYPHNVADFYRMLRNQWKSSSELEVIQNRKLRRLIEHVYNNVPYYRKLFDSMKLKPADIKTVHDLSKIPTISSKIYRIIPLEEILSKKTELNKCVSVSTNGTSGLPLKIFFTKNDYTQLNLNWVRPLLANGVRPWHKRAVFARPHILSEKKKWYQYLGLWRNQGISSFEEPDVWVAKLREYKPDVLFGYSTTLKLLAQFIKTKKITDIRPRIVFAVSELLDGECRELINDVFQAKIVDLYGAAETGCIAWECLTCSKYHLNTDTLIVEFLRGDQKVLFGSEGKIVVTNLHSFAMPIIRYELGDIGIASDKKALCGRGLPSMRIILGRSDDFIALPSGKLLSPRFFSAIILQVVGIDQWKVIQDDSGCLNILVVPSEDFLTKTVSQLKDRIVKNAGEEIQIHVRIVDEIPFEPSGKLRAVVSKVTNNVF
ncbi:MAG: hypothetical protein O2U61_04100 [Candidatus Bathyarchaeota archaeon]|nr:hypothetical protein [Candidatus Bathyarchaeota archaeon]